ncbi:hypothetical protein [Micromonospora rifamycinica]|uniref:Uncharacterized protein n=1 Tax=Micromonospora rifamycinica TaxID=291594 RepID=A0A1C5H0C9_9ACTN|nr:hypothetical protein [Micromonospora rifamycinica]SCG39496.1 hypothetical protein GA0070623_0554 [Micromonospora rifamycinica]
MNVEVTAIEVDIRRLVLTGVDGPVDGTLAAEVGERLGRLVADRGLPAAGTPTTGPPTGGDLPTVLAETIWIRLGPSAVGR